MEKESNDNGNVKLNFWQIIKLSGDKYVKQQIANPESNCSKAKAFAKNKEGFYPKKKRNMGWAYEYSEKQYDRMAQNVKEIEDKADLFLRNIGTEITVIIAVLALMAGQGSLVGGKYLLLLFIPMGICAALTAILIMKIRNPQDQSAPPRTNIALKFANHYEDEDIGKGRFATLNYVATEELRATMDYKSSTMDWAVIFFILNLFFSTLPLGYMLIHFFLDP